jgi:hypothetical protein
MEPKRSLGHHQKNNTPQIMDIKEEKIQTNSINNLYNNIIAENFPKLEKGRDIQVQEAYRTPNYQDQKRNTPRHIIIKILNIQNKDRILQPQKRKDWSHIKRNPSK